MMKEVFFEALIETNSRPNATLEAWTPIREEAIPEFNLGTEYKSGALY